MCLLKNRATLTASRVNTDVYARLSPAILSQESSGIHQAESRAVSPPARAEEGQDRDTCDREDNFGEIKPGRERRRLGVLRTDEKVFVQMARPASGNFCDRVYEM